MCLPHSVVMTINARIRVNAPFTQELAYSRYIRRFLVPTLAHVFVAPLSFGNRSSEELENKPGIVFP